jgi:hypothetical protein
MDFGNGRIRKVRWFFAAKDALPIPGPNAFHSLNWVPKEEWPDTLGEVAGVPRPWSNGATPNGFLNGQRPLCAPLDIWANGVPAEWPDLIYGADLVPECCRGLTGIIWIAELRFKLTALTDVPPRPPATYSEDGHIYMKSSVSQTREKINPRVGNLAVEAGLKLAP